MADRPTEQAEWAFNRASAYFSGRYDNVQPAHLAIMLTEMAKGLVQLSIGLRATYMAIDEIKLRLDRQGQLPPGAFPR